MTRLYVAPERLRAGALTLGDADHRRLARVLRVRPGDPLVLFDGTGAEAEARVTQVTSRAVTVEVGARRKVPAAATHIVLLHGLGKGDRNDLAVQKTTELGVGTYAAIVTARSVPRPEVRAAAARAARWTEIAREAAAQSGRADVPVIHPPRPLAAGLQDLPATALRYALWEGRRGDVLSARLARDLGAGRPAAVVLLVGPEGGIEEAEIAAAERAGFAAVGLGARVLRTETAAIVAVALVQAALGEM